jgi:hypothetical protein
MIDNKADATFVENVARLTQPVPAVHTIFDQRVLTLGDTIQVFDDPDERAPRMLSFSTLQAVVDYFPYALTDETAPPVVQVVSEAHVRILRPVVGARRQQFVYADAAPVLPSVMLGRFQDMESFLIQLLTSFVESEERERCQAQIGKLKPGLLSEIEDDGLTQSVSTREGLTRATTGKVVNRFGLTRFCTFPEVPQPAVPYVLRIRQVKDGEGLAATAALFEADGGAWRPRTIADIGAWLRERLGPDVTVLA